MRRSLKVKLSLIGAVLAVGALADDIKANKGKADASFVEEAYVNSQAEVRLSQLAVRQSSDPAVKQFAQQMIDDHTKANDALKQVAEGKGFTLPAEMSSTTGTTGSVGGATNEGTVTGERMGAGDNRMGTGSPIPSKDTTGSATPPSSGTYGSREPSTTPGSEPGSVGSTGSSTGELAQDTANTAKEGARDTANAAKEGARDTASAAKEGARDTLGAAKPYTGFTMAQRTAMKKYDELAKKTGADFDKAYLSAIIDDHKKNIKLFERESKRGDDAELKSWATNTLPTLRHHLEMAQAIEKDVKGRRTNNM